MLLEKLKLGTGRLVEQGDGGFIGEMYIVEKYLENNSAVFRAFKFEDSRRRRFVEWLATNGICE